MKTNPFDIKLVSSLEYSEDDDTLHTIEEIELVNKALRGQTNYLGFIGMMFLLALMLFGLFYIVATLPQNIALDVSNIIGILNK